MSFGSALGSARRSWPGRPGLAGVLAAPGPQPPHSPATRRFVIAERITKLVVPADGGPRDVCLATLGAPQAAAGAGRVAFTDWADGSDQYAAAAALLEPGRALCYFSTQPGRCTCSAFRDRLHGSSYVA